MLLRTLPAMQASSAAFAYFGTPYVARDTLMKLCDAGFVPAVVITSPDAPKGRGMALTPCPTKEWAQERGLPVLTPAKLDDAFQAGLSAYGCEYGIAVAYGKLIPESVLASFPKGILNVHYSLLPKYRGASPVEMALWNGDAATGVSIQQMAYELDAGDVLAQEEMAIDPSDTTLTLRPKLIEAGAELLIRTLPAFLDGTAARAPQAEMIENGALATRAPKIPEAPRPARSLRGPGTELEHLPRPARIPRHVFLRREGRRAHQGKDYGRAPRGRALRGAAHHP